MNKALFMEGKYQMKKEKLKMKIQNKKMKNLFWCSKSAIGLGLKGKDMNHCNALLMTL